MSDTRQVPLLPDRLVFDCPMCGKTVVLPRDPDVMEGRARSFVCPHCKADQTIRRDTSRPLRRVSRQPAAAPASDDTSPVRPGCDLFGEPLPAPGSKPARPRRADVPAVPAGVRVEVTRPGESARRRCRAEGGVLVSVCGPVPHGLPVVVVAEELERVGAANWFARKLGEAGHRDVRTEQGFARGEKS